MSPAVALVIGCVGIAWLFRMDARWRTVGSRALWIPAAWLAILGSRPVSYWTAMMGAGNDPGGSVEGSPANLAVLLMLMVAAALVLRRRGLDWGAVVRTNRALFLLYGFFALSALWSECGAVSFKRVVKDFGCVVAALVLLTERDPVASIRAVCVRVSYVLFPLSMVLGKYFPDIGRNYSISGEPMFTGVTTQKNSLGQMVLVLWLAILLDVLEGRHSRSASARVKRWMGIAMLALGGWLLVASQSRTSLVCLALGVLLFWGTGRVVRQRRPRQALVCWLTVAIGLMAFSSLSNVARNSLAVLGRDATLTGRTDIWQVVRAHATHPLVGAGFLAFWDGVAGRAIYDEFTAVNNAHNGYLDVYLDGGVVGAVLLGLLLLASVRKTIGDVIAGTPWGRMGFVLCAIAMIYNVAESSFFRLGPLWLMLILVTIRPVVRRRPAAPAPVPATASAAGALVPAPG